MENKGFGNRGQHSSRRSCLRSQSGSLPKNLNELGTFFHVATTTDVIGRVPCNGQDTFGWSCCCPQQMLRQNVDPGLQLLPGVSRDDRVAHPQTMGIPLSCQFSFYAIDVTEAAAFRPLLLTNLKTAAKATNQCRSLTSEQLLLVQDVSLKTMIITTKNDRQVLIVFNLSSAHIVHFSLNVYEFLLCKRNNSLSTTNSPMRTCKKGCRGCFFSAPS